jgi:hypothetical protein
MSRTPVDRPQHGLELAPGAGDSAEFHGQGRGPLSGPVAEGEVDDPPLGQVAGNRPGGLPGSEDGHPLGVRMTGDRGTDRRSDPGRSGGDGRLGPSGPSEAEGGGGRLAQLPAERAVLLGERHRRPELRQDLGVTQNGGLQP